MRILFTKLHSVPILMVSSSKWKRYINTADPKEFLFCHRSRGTTSNGYISQGIEIGKIFGRKKSIKLAVWECIKFLFIGSIFGSSKKEDLVFYNWSIVV